MRKALDSIYNKLETLDIEEDSYADEVIASVKSDIVDAIYAPPRNCDVGTAEEQVKSYFAFCDRHTCQSCPVKGTTDCGFLWEQMPYEEGDEK